MGKQLKLKQGYLFHIFVIINKFSFFLVLKFILLNYNKRFQLNNCISKLLSNNKKYYQYLHNHLNGFLQQLYSYRFYLLLSYLQKVPLTESIIFFKNKQGKQNIKEKVTLIYCQRAPIIIGRVCV